MRPTLSDIARKLPLSSQFMRRIDNLAAENRELSGKLSMLRERLDAATEESIDAPSAQPTATEDSFDHHKAQAYELEHARLWITENANWVWEMFDRAQAGAREVHDIVLHEFFASQLPIWGAFAHSLEGKALLDVGSGPVPTPAIWPWPSKHYVIDPLAHQYDLLVRQQFNRSWFEGLTIFSEAAEHNVAELNGKIDGAIYCRNCLDHCAEPYLVLSNLASYAAPGCTLLLWTDLYHLDGHDEGHRNITSDLAGFRRLIENLGFAIKRDTPEAKGRGTINMGCFAIKER